MYPDLATEAGRATLTEAMVLVRSLTEQDVVRRAAQARQLMDERLAAAAMTQLRLRERARAKFGSESDELFFTTDGLQQATRPQLAAHRAARFAAAGISSVLDLCCGIGSDALAFQRAELAVLALDRDPDTAAVAVANLRGTAAQVVVSDAETSNWRDAESVFIDPARRTGTAGDARRTFDPASFSPGFDFVLELLSQSRFAAAKLAPGLRHELIPAAMEAEWVSFAGGVKEAVIWSAAFTGATIRRRATVFPAGSPTSAQLTNADPGEKTVAAIAEFIYEPDGAVIRAGLVQQAAALLQGWRIDEHLAYLSSDRAADNPLAKGYRVLDVIPYSVRRLKAELIRRSVGTVEIKKRGVDVDPAQLRRQLRPSGPNALTVILARVGDRHLAILAQPLNR